MGAGLLWRWYLDDVHPRVGLANSFVSNSSGDDFIATDETS